MRTHRSMLRALAIGAVTLLFVAIGVQAKDTATGDGQRLEGSWVLTATIEGEPLIHALITFNGDGSFVESAAAPGISTGHGTWTRIGNHRFSLTNVYLRLGSAGEFIGTSKVRATFELRDTLNEGGGRFETTVFDAEGNQIDAFGGEAQARRISPEPLE